MTAQIIERNNHYLLSGPITFDRITPLYRELLRICKTKSESTINLDLELVTESDSAAVALLVAINQTRDVVIHNLNRNVANLMQLYGVDWLQINTETRNDD